MAQWVILSATHLGSAIGGTPACRWKQWLGLSPGSFLVHCKIAYCNWVTTEQWLVVSLGNFVTIRKTPLTISCKIFSWNGMMKLKIHAVEFCNFIKDFVSPSGLFVSGTLTMISMWRPRLIALCSIAVSFSRLLSTGPSVDSQISACNNC